MAMKVAQMTTDELRELIGAVLEKKLRELLEDPDEGLQIREKLRRRLVRQRKAVAAGERGDRLEDVVARLGLR